MSADKLLDEVLRRNEAYGKMTMGELFDFADRMSADNARLRAALEPLAEYAPYTRWPDNLVISNGSSMARKQLTAGDCRRARDAMRAQQIIDEAMKVRP